MAKRIKQSNAYTDDLSGLSYDDFIRKYNTLEEYSQDFVEGFVLNRTDIGIDTINDEVIDEWLSNPEDNYKDIADYMTYMSMSDGSIYQLYTIFQTGSKLDYRIKAFDTTQTGYDKNIIMCDKLLRTVRYKQITRDLIYQECSRGFVVCMWLGDKKRPYLHVFDDIEHVFPAYRRNGEWVCQVDMSMFDNMKDTERNIFFETLSPYVTEVNYDAYKADIENNKYVELPQERTVCLRINTVYRNQRIGFPMGIQSLFSYSHKQTLRKLEKAIVNKIIKNVAVLTIGNDKNGYTTVNKSMKKKIVSSVKSTLEKANSSKKMPFTILPEYAKLEFPKVDGIDGLQADKFDAIDNDISMDIGVSSGLVGSNSSSNFAIAKLNKTMLYKRLDCILEGIEEVFDKLFSLYLPKSVYSNIYFEFVKGEGLDDKSLVDILMKLNAQGYSVKEVCDLIGLNFNQFINQSIYEIEEMELREKISPPSTSYTMSGSDVGKPENDNPENEATISSKSSGKNESKKA